MHYFLRHGGHFFFFLLLISGTAFAKSSGESVPGQFIVKLKSQYVVQGPTQLQSSLGGEIKKRLSDESRLILLQRPSVEVEEQSLRALSENNLVEYAEPNFVYRALAGAKNLPNDPDFGAQWSMVNTGQVTTGDMGTINGKPGVDIGAKDAWPLEVNAKNILIAVIDSGMIYTHPDLILSSYRNLAERNGTPGVDDDGNGYTDDIYGYDFYNDDSDPVDDMGHGTHIAGIIGARGDNDSGIVGVAWSSSILPIKALDANGYGDTSAMIRALDYAIKMNVKIINISWGGNTSQSRAMLDALTRVRAAGILVVAAAGNNGSNNDNYPSYPSSYPLDNIISVAALSPAGRLSNRSNFGPNSVHIAAPGVNILSYNLNGMESLSGTSMAAPHVAGVAALLWAQDFSQTYSTIRQRILSGVQPLGALRSRVAAGGSLNAFYALANQVAPVDPTDPYSWERQPQSVTSGHPYPDEMDKTWTFTVPGAQKVVVHFSSFSTESGYDRVRFTDPSGADYGFLDGDLGEVFSPIIPGDTVVVNFISDSSVSKEGFDIDYVSFQ